MRVQAALEDLFLRDQGLEHGGQLGGRRPAVQLGDGRLDRVIAGIAAFVDLQLVLLEVVVVDRLVGVLFDLADEDAGPVDHGRLLAVQVAVAFRQERLFDLRRVGRKVQESLGQVVHIALHLAFNST